MELKKNLRAADLSLAACRSRQSARTGFLHHFPADDSARDTIPIYENFCFVQALFKHKTLESVLEGKELLLRLLGFQTEDGNFPIFLHDFPRCWDRLLPLKVAPVLISVLRDFSTMVGEEAVDKYKRSLTRALEFAEKTRRFKPFEPLWEMRYQACRGLDWAEFTPKTAEEWFEWVVSKQLVCSQFSPNIPYSKELQIFLGGYDIQEKGEPKPTPIEWLLAEKEGFSKRLKIEHSGQIYTSLARPLESSLALKSPFLPAHVSCGSGVTRILWLGERLHSLHIPREGSSSGEFRFDLEEFSLSEREEPVEIELFADFSRETNVTIEGKKGTVFSLGEAVTLSTPTLTFNLHFELIEGEGDFLGHISRGNRPSENSSKESYDWRIFIRTLRRASRCTLLLRLELYCARTETWILPASDIH